MRAQKKEKGTAIYMWRDPSFTAEEQGKLFSHIQLNSASTETNACFTTDVSMTAE